MKKKIIIAISVPVGIVIVLLSVVFIINYLSYKPQPDMQEKLKKYCKNHSEIQLTEITDFEWDKAYFDYDSYQSGEVIKGKYRLTGDFETLDSDYLFRIAFCKDGKLVEDVIWNVEFLEFEESIEVISPETIFSVEWIQESDDIEILYLTEKK